MIIIQRIRNRNKDIGIIESVVEEVEVLILR
jgi:hypothetical protein